MKKMILTFLVATACLFASAQQLGPMHTTEITLPKGLYWPGFRDVNFGPAGEVLRGVVLLGHPSLGDPMPTLKAMLPYWMTITDYYVGSSLTGNGDYYWHVTFEILPLESMSPRRLIAHSISPSFQTPERLQITQWP